ncbi:MAG: C25 family cysteine peptidase, partial [Candidatus Omnitrophica bacterium]|nr:C25 family cysteine peptidase [Candidatus Omnitrophota bacterium]
MCESWLKNYLFSRFFQIKKRSLLTTVSILTILLTINNISYSAEKQDFPPKISSQKIIESNLHNFSRSLEINPSIANQGKGQLQVSIKFPEEFPVISLSEGGSQKIQFAENHEYLLTNHNGKTPVPYYTLNIVVPKDAKDFKISNIKTKEIQKEINQPLTFEQAEEKNKSAKTNREQKSSNVKILGTSQFRDITFLTLQIFPVDYNSSNHIITQTQGIQFNLSFQTRASDNTVKIKNPEKNVFHKIYQSQFLNYQWKKDTAILEGKNKPKTQGEYRVLTAQQILDPAYDTNTQFFPDYLVIRSQAFINSASFNSWLNHRVLQAGGAHTIGVISLETLYSAYSSGTNQQRIKNCISFLYQNWRQSANIADITYLLLIGDADYGSEAQSWFMPTWDSNNQTTGITGDNKYGCLIGNDDIPELLIGRFPIKDETELSTIINKTLSFENNPPQGENHYGTRHLFLGGSAEALYPSSNGARYTLLENYQESEEYNNREVYNNHYPNFTFIHHDPMIHDLINNKGVLTIAYNGNDGTEEGWQPENIDLDALNNTNDIPALVISASSRTARFDWIEGDCFGERWIKKTNGGALAFLGPSRTTTTNPSFFADEEILKGIYKNGAVSLGASVFQAILRFAVTPGCEEQYRYNLLGDPAVNITNHLGLSSKPEAKVLFNADMPQHPLAGENIPLNISVKNVGRGTLPAYTFQGFYYDYAGDIPLSDEIHISPNLMADGTYTVKENWEFQEKFWEHFRVDTQMGVPINEWVDELSEFNNIDNSNVYFSVQYPMHFNPNNTTGIEVGSYEHPYTKLKYPYPDNTNKGMQKIINAREPGLRVTIYFYPGIYGEEEGQNTFTLRDMSLTGEGESESIVIKQDSFDCIGSIEFNNIAFNVPDGVPIVTEDILSVKNCIFYGNQTGVQVQNTWAFYNDGYSADITNNIFFNNTNAIKIIDEKINVPFINNVVYDNTRFVNISSGEDSSNSLNIKNNIIRENFHNLINPLQINIQNNFNNTDIDYLLAWGSNNINVNPEFIDPNNSNFHLAETSPCVDAGDPDPIYNDLDGSRNDMGAYGGPNAYAPIKITSP